MAATYDLVLQNGTAVTPSGTITADVGVRNGKIAALGLEAGDRAAHAIDCTGLHILPGVIDSQVHFREPGAPHKEDLSTGTLAAILGGVTTVFEMPNTNPLTLWQRDLEDKLARAAGRAYCDHAFFIGGSAENAAQLRDLEKLPGCAGVKVFMGSSTGSLLAAEDDVLASILQSGQRRVAIHAEDEARLKQRKEIAETRHDVKDHPLWRDAESAFLATRRIVSLARKARRRLHILHVTTAEEIDFLAAHKDLVTVEVLPQHLTLFAPACYEHLGTKAQMNPPIRERQHQDALWRGIQNGVVDVLGSDHAPHTLEEKAKEYPASPSGMPGVQTLLPLMLHHVNTGRLTLERLVDLLCHGPQRVYQIAGKGRLAVGYDADFSVVDLNKSWTVTDKAMASRCGWTPYAGMQLQGAVAGTILRGRPVMWEGEILGAAAGQPVHFSECIPPYAGTSSRSKKASG